jgi:HD-GYP domain-containing protein (c-di-GMP phosphodiesterase class II)
VEAVKELKRCAAAHFDPRVVDAFQKAFSDVSALPISI